MSLRERELPDWKFLKLKHVLDDGTKKPTKTKYPWEAKKIRDLLDQIDPPGTYTAAHKKYKYMVSEEEATLEEVKKLGSQVQQIIEDRDFPSRGVHQERHLLYSALFDELIRQVVIEHPDLGEILLRIRDHFRQEIYNYELLYDASQAYGYRKQFTEKNDERLNELEAEEEHLRQEQKRALRAVETAYQENVKLIAECKNIRVDEAEYSRTVNFYRNYIEHLLSYFEIRAQGEKGEAEVKEEETEEEVEEEETDPFEGFAMGDDKWIEEEEEIPEVGEKEVKVTTTKQEDEEPIDNDLIYRENEEEVFDSDILYTEESVASELPKSQDDVLPPSETDPQERLQMLLEEDLKNDITFADMELGFRKKAYEEELKAIEEKKKHEEEQKRLEEERKKLELEMSKIKRKKKRQPIEEEGEEFSEEDLEEEVEEESVRKTILSLPDEFASFGMPEERKSSVYPEKIDGIETDEDIPLLSKPKFKFLRSLINPVRCKDLVQRIPEPTIKRKVKKKVLVKKRKIRSKAPTLVESILEDKEIPKERIDKSLTDVSESEFKSGIPLLKYFQQIGRKISEHDRRMTTDSELDAQDKKEDETGDIIYVPKTDEADAEESDLFSSGLTVGTTGSYHSSQESKHSLTSTDVEEEEKVGENGVEEE